MSELSEIRDRHYKGVRSTDLDIGASVLAPDVENLLPGRPSGSANGVDGWKRFSSPFFNAFSRVEIHIVKSLEMDAADRRQPMLLRGGVHVRQRCSAPALQLTERLEEVPAHAQPDPRQVSQPVPR